MRFAFLAPRFHGNQADLVRKLVEEGHQVAFFVMRMSPSEDHSVVRPTVVPRWVALSRLAGRCWNRTNDPAKDAALALPRVMALYRGLHRFRPEVIVLRGFFVPYILLAVPYFLARRLRVVVYTQGPKYRTVLPWRLRLFYRVAFDLLGWRWFTTVERRMTEEADAMMTDDRLEFIPFFKYVRDGASERSYDVGCPRLLGVGKFEVRKNFANVVQAFARVQAIRSCRLTLIGECTRPEHGEVVRQLEGLIVDLGVADRVVLRLNCRFEEVQDAYRSHDLFVMASYRESASVAQIEAMAYGLPIVCCRDNGSAHYVAAGVNGVHVDPSAESLETALGFFLASPARLAEFGRNSVRALEGPLSVGQAYARLMDLVTREDPRHVRPGSSVAMTRRTAA